MLIPTEDVNNLKQFMELNKRLTEDDLVIFTIDGVLIDTHTTLGSIYHYEAYKHALNKSSKDNATLEALKVYWRAQKYVQVILIEPEMKTLIEDLQARNIPIIFITHRCEHQIGKDTVRQINDVGLDPNKGRFENINFRIPVEDQEIILDKGILYANGKGDKGIAIKSFLNMTAYQPNAIISIDRSIDNLHKQKEIFKNMIALHYTRNEYQENYYTDFTIANIQHEHMARDNKIMSDGDAARIAYQRKKLR